VTVSFGLLTVAVLGRYVGELLTVTGTVIVGKKLHTASQSLRVHVQDTAHTLPVQLHHAPVGVLLSVTHAGSGSDTVVRDATRGPVHTF